MHPAEIHYLAVVKRCTTLSVQFAAAFEQAQARLNMGAVLTQERLSNREGTRLSQHTLAEMRQLMAEHSTGYQKLILAYAQEIATAIDALPGGQAEEYRKRLETTLREEITLQSEFLQARTRWLDAAEAICELIESHRASCSFSDAGVDFEDDRDLQHFCDLLGVIEECHQIEVAIFQARRDKIEQRLALG